MDRKQENPVIFTFTESDFLVRIRRDKNPEDVRSENFQNMASMAIPPSTFTQGTKLGDREFQDTVLSVSDLGRMLQEREAEFISMPLYGIRKKHGLSGREYFQLNSAPYFGDERGQRVGYMFVSNYKVREAYKVDKITSEIYDGVLMTFSDEMMLYNMYLIGDVYCYEIENSDGQVVAQGDGIFDLDAVMDAAKTEIALMKENDYSLGATSLDSMVPGKFMN